MSQASFDPGSYIRVFTKSSAWSRFLGLSATDYAVFVQLLLSMQAGGLISTQTDDRREIALNIDCSERTVYRSLKNLRDREIIIPAGVNLYNINPRLAWMGPEKSRKEILRETR